MESGTPVMRASDPEGYGPEVQKLLARPSTMPACEGHLLHFNSESEARALYEAVGGFLSLFGKLWNLERLCEITISYKYTEALANIDQGTGKRPGMTATRDDFATGVAMAARVLRDGKPRVHLVLDAHFIGALMNPNEERYEQAIYILAHESCHIHDLSEQDRAFPGVILAHQLTAREGVLQQIAEVAWEEYAACRLSASFAPANETALFEKTLCSVLAGARERGNKYIRQYRLHGDVSRVLKEIVGEYGNLLKYSSYLLGHLAGIDAQLKDAAPTAAAMIEGSPFFAPAFHRLKTGLEEMWETYGKWTGFEIFDGLKELADGFLKTGGIVLQDHKEGLYVNVPYSLETLPDLA